MPVPGRSVLMTQKKLAAWLRFVIIGFAVVGAGAYFWAIPQFGLSIVGRYPEFAYAFRPWVALIWATAIPCYAALVVAWKVADSLAAERPFVPENATRFRAIARLAYFDSALFLVGNIVYTFLNMTHPGILLMALGVVFVGAAIGVVCQGLAGLVDNAADLQQQSDLTI